LSRRYQSSGISASPSNSTGRPFSWKRVIGPNSRRL
jgi:hypothetical protein